MDEVHRGLKNGHRMVVPASPGSGRTELVDALAEQLEQVIKVSPLPLAEVDGPSTLLLETAAAVAEGGTRRELIDAPDVVSSAERLAVALAEAKKTLVIRVPSSWSAAADRGHSKAEPWRKVWRIVDVWLQHRELKTVLIGGRPALECFSSHSLSSTQDAAQLWLQTERLLDVRRWGTYADAARMVHAHLGSATNQRPWRIRAVIGVVGLYPDVDLEFAFSAPISELAGLYRSALQRRNDEDALKEVVGRFVALRRPVGKADLPRLTKVSNEQLVLLTECLGYGDPVRPFEPLRDALRRALTDNVAPAEDHAHLGDHYRELDGAASPWDLTAPEIRAWTEKAHHWAKAGSLRSAEWTELEKFGPEQYWDRGRDLSLRGDYEAAATVYSACVDAYVSDDYAWHYLGFNLERAGIDRGRAEAAYRRAVELAPDNPWWNSRLVTFLIHRARHDAARREWSLARSRVDPEEYLVEQSPWLAEHLHHWVAREWLEVGQPRDAYDVFAPVPQQIVTSSPRLDRLAGQLADELEALELGHAVYPRHVSYAKRWQAPRLLPEVYAGHTRSSWFPGRVLRAEEDHVDVAYADPEEETPRRLQISKISREDWSRWCSDAPAKDQHLELGVYGEDTRLLRVDPEPESAEDALDVQRLDAVLGYIRQWKRRNQGS